MRLILKGIEFDRLGHSSYNHNYYQHKKEKYSILEVCHEDENYYEFFLMEGLQKIFIGCSSEGISPNGVTNIDFKVYYT